ncbi:MAG TPA: magnesium transporter CorA family protein [Anaerolineales bacterium]|nr:magnesium transporter CorA family protein [Anaerolineales bacterium]
MMITIFNHTASGLLTQDEISAGCWINVVDPDAAEIARLQELGIPPDFITYPLDMDEQARTERDDGATLIVVRIPFYQGDNYDVPYSTLPLGIILTDRLILTICKRENEIVQGFSSGRMRDLSTAKRYRFVLRLLLRTAQSYLAYLREINKVVDALEDQLQRSTRNKEVLELLKYQKSLTYFTTALKSNELLMERLQRMQVFKTYPEDEDLLEDVLIENRQAIEMTNIASNILSSMMDAFASIISNNLNGVMKFLASVTIVLSLPTIVTGLWGMNVGVPMTNAGSAFLAILGFIFLITLATVFIFWKRDWF